MVGLHAIQAQVAPTGGQSLFLCPAQEKTTQPGAAEAAVSDQAVYIAQAPGRGGRFQARQGSRRRGPFRRVKAIAGENSDCGRRL